MNEPINTLLMSLIAKSRYHKNNEDSLIIFDSSRTAILFYDKENKSCFFSENFASKKLIENIGQLNYENTITDSIKLLFERYLPNVEILYIGEKDLSEFRY